MILIRKALSAVENLEFVVGAEGLEPAKQSHCDCLQINMKGVLASDSYTQGTECSRKFGICGGRGGT